MSRCEDYPCCGHTDRDPCPGQAVLDEPWYCDECGIYHMHHPDSDYIRDIHEPEEDDDYDDGLDDYLAWEQDQYNREYQEEALGRPLFPNEY